MRRILPLELTLAALLASGCASTTAPVQEDSPGSEAAPAGSGDGYLAAGPTAHLQDARNDRYQSPLLALRDRSRELEEARATIQSLEERVLELQEERSTLAGKNADLESRLAVSHERLESEKDVKKEMAEALARLRIRTVRLEQELFQVKLEFLRPEGSEGQTPPASPPADPGTQPAPAEPVQPSGQDPPQAAQEHPGGAR